MSQQRSLGRPSKGKRHWVNSGIPEDQYSVYEAAADELGIHLSTYFALKMAEAHGLEPARWVTDEVRRAQLRRADEELPMARAG
ncbi:hypothetical protein [Agromyces bauzanensis]